MAGGLIQIASYGIHDIFLIGNPQITFFKIVYRRHSNFAMEYLEEQLNGTQNFGGYLTCNLSKAGDLLHKMYLKITIPQVAIDRMRFSIAEKNINSSYQQFLYSYNQIQQFINAINFNIIQPLYKLLNINNLRYSEINSKYTIALNRMNYNGKINQIKDIKIAFNKTFNIPLSNGTTNIIHINEQTNMASILDFNIYFGLYVKQQSQTLITDLKFLLDNYCLQLQIIKQNMYEMLLFFQNTDKIMNRQNINFAWVEYLGHQIIEKIEVEIGGKMIDFTDAVRINIGYQLSNKILHDITYSKLIGNVPELTTFNYLTKPSYIMYIPLDFWFCKYSGLSLPLIYLRFHDVKINVKINDLVNCCYYEQLNSDTVIEELIQLTSVTLIANYVYLDTDERRKFAQLSHEYLIDQTQIANFTDITTTKLNVELPFFNPIKQLYWVARDINNIQRLKYFEYSTSYYVDIYEFLNAYENSEIDQTLKTSRNMIKVKTVDSNLENNIKVGDTIKIINSIYYSSDYTVKKIDAEYLYIEYDSFLKEDYKNNYDVYVRGNETNYLKSSNYMGNSQAFICKVNNKNPIKLSTLQLNGVQRFYKVDGIYTNFVQPYQHNSKSPNYGLNTYSFALVPEEYQPSGFCNFNRLDLKTMTFEFDKNYINESNGKKLDVLIYAHNYNILRFAYGKAGIILNI
jgi:Large eukaryotic DNA virus major capsid protein/Major capsid protein N-terminus